MDFYSHEIYESMMMKKGMDYQEARSIAKEFYNAKEFNFYHPDVIEKNPKWFNNA